ncbi:MAG: dockerin type I domain-containing protein, partial [Planctomycetota bacterium]
MPLVLLIAFSAVSVSAQSQLIGDLSGNFEVDGEDLWIVAEQWLNTGGCSEPNCADLYVDGQVDFLDFTILAQNWKKKVY